MATDPLAAIRTINFRPYYSGKIESGDIYANMSSYDENEAKSWLDQGGTYSTSMDADWDALKNAGFQSKFNKVTDLGNGRFAVELQQPGAHKYDLMQAIYAKDPATGQYTLQGTPTNYKQQSSMTEHGQGYGAMLAAAGTAMFAPGLAQALGGGALGGAGAGAILGAGNSAIGGGNSSQNLRAGIAGGIAGGIGGYMSEPSAVTGGASSTTPSAAQSGIGATTQANQLTPAALESLIGTPGYGVNAAANSYLQSIGMAPTAGWNAYGLGNTQGAQLADTEALLNSGDWSSPFTTPQVPTEVPSDFSPTQQVEVVGQAPVAPTTPTVIPPTIPSAAETAQPTPSKGTAPAEEPEQPSLGGKFTDFLKNNPRLALTMLGMLGGGGGGNSSGGGGAGAGGAQGNLTATQAPKFQRQYVAPPEGYRPGFDPEHRYFTGIGNAGTGG